MSGPRDGAIRAVEMLLEARNMLMRFYFAGLVTGLGARVFLTYLVFTSTIQVIVSTCLVSTLMGIASYVFFVSRPKFLLSEAEEDPKQAQPSSFGTPAVGGS